VCIVFFFFFQAEDGIRDFHVTGVQTCALPISQVSTDVQLASASTLTVTATTPASVQAAVPGNTVSVRKQATASAVTPTRPVIATVADRPVRSLASAMASSTPITPGTASSAVAKIRHASTEGDVSG